MIFATLSMAAVRGEEGKDGGEGKGSEGNGREGKGREGKGGEEVERGKTSQ
jgi:hypothetical protein